MYTIYTDGAYSKLRNSGGAAFLILNEEGKVVLKSAKGYSNSTNQRMEMLACINALSCVTEPSDITIVTDSMYIVGTYTMNWRRKCNNDLWAQFDEVKEKHNVTFTHVKGHKGDKYNTIVDGMAVEASHIN